jgi:hypothetical protein
MNELDPLREAAYRLDDALTMIRADLLGGPPAAVDVIQAHEVLRAVLSECDGHNDAGYPCGTDGVLCWPCAAKREAVEG